MDQGAKKKPLGESLKSFIFHHKAQDYRQKYCKILKKSVFSLTKQILYHKYKSAHNYPSKIIKKKIPIQTWNIKPEL